MSVTIEDIEKAARLVAGRVVATPTFFAPRLSVLTGAEVFVKYENMQATGSFKDRGALVKLESLTPDERRRGVIAMSAGNHAQAVAYHAQHLGIPATIIMPVTTPFVKLQNTRSYGARVVLHGEQLSESQTKCEQLIAAEDLVLVHPYDDPHVIAGQGTLALEMLEAVPDLESLVVPIGGGGLISGVALAAKAKRPGIDIVGAEAELYPSFWNAIHAESRPIGGPTLAEGIAVKNVGRMTLPIVRDHVDEIVLVGESELERAVNAFATLQRTLAEGAGAAGLAAMLAKPGRFAGRKVGLVLCGGNIDPRILAAIMVRELERTGNIVSFRITGLDRPGLLASIAQCLARSGANILEVSHKRLLLDVPAKGVTLDLTVEARDRAHIETIFADLAAQGLTPRRLGQEGAVGSRS
jgi:threonine dehydratase